MASLDEDDIHKASVSRFVTSNPYAKLCKNFIEIQFFDIRSQTFLESREQFWERRH